MKILNGATELVPVSTLTPHPRNVNAGDVGAIHESIEHNGFFGSLVVQKSTRHILAGAHRWRVASEAGYPEVPVTWVDVDDAAALRIMLADNRTARLGHDEPGALAALLQEIHADAGSLLGTAYSQADLDALLAELGIGGEAAGVDPGPQIDRAEELREKWGTERGQIWAIPSNTVPGKSHRLMSGDSTNAEDVGRLMAAELAEVMWSDPPYGVSYVGKTKAALTIENDGAEGLPALLDGAFAAADGVLAPSARIYLAAPAGPQGTEFRLAIRRVGWSLHQVLVWVKSVMVLGHSDYHYRHEDVLYGYKPGPGRIGRGNHEGTRWYGDHSQTTVFEIDKPSRNGEHPTMNPVELVVPMLRNSSRRGDIVLDLFGGSGTTVVACEQAGRIGRVMELDPGYVAVILERLTGMGLEPHRVTRDEPP